MPKYVKRIKGQRTRSSIFVLLRNSWRSILWSILAGLKPCKSLLCVWLLVVVKSNHVLLWRQLQRRWWWMAMVARWLLVVKSIRKLMKKPLVATIAGGINYLRFPQSLLSFHHHMTSFNRCSFDLMMPRRGPKSLSQPPLRSIEMSRKCPL